MSHDFSQKSLLDVVGSDRDSLDDELHTPRKSKLCGEHSSLAAFCPVFGSILYVAGSILFFPGYDMMDLGCIFYMVGIVFYLLGGLPHLLTLGTRHPDRSLLCVGVAAEVGLYAAKILYTIGSVFFMEQYSEQFGKLGAWAFIVGSFVLCIAIFGKDMLRGPIQKAAPWQDRLMMNWCSNTSFTASVVWLCATFVYIIQYETSGDAAKMLVYGAAMYTFGSFLFLVSSTISFLFVLRRTGAAA